MIEGALFIVPLCFLAIWAIAVSTVLDLPKRNQSAKLPFKSFKRLPCRNCEFFSSNPYLKCAIHPSAAMTEHAMNCPDYRACQPKNFH